MGVRVVPGRGNSTYKGLEARESMVCLGNQIKVFVLGFLAGVCNGTHIFCE